MRRKEGGRTRSEVVGERLEVHEKQQKEECCLWSSWRGNTTARCSMY